MSLQLPEQYRHSEVFGNDTGLVLTVPCNSYWTPGMPAIKEILNNLSSVMTAQGYAPAEDFKNYEGKIKRDLITRGLKAGTRPGIF